MVSAAPFAYEVVIILNFSCQHCFGLRLGKCDYSLSLSASLLKNVLRFR